MTPIARVLDAIVRRTLLSRLGYHEGLTPMQLWVVHHLAVVGEQLLETRRHNFVLFSKLITSLLSNIKFG
jgi:hypothetical protein